MLVAGYGPYLSRDFCLALFGEDPHGFNTQINGFDLYLISKDKLAPSLRESGEIPEGTQFYFPKRGEGIIAVRIMELDEFQREALVEFEKGLHPDVFLLNIETQTGVLKAEFFGNDYIQDGQVIEGLGYPPIPNNEDWYMRRAKGIARISGTEYSRVIRVKEEAREEGVRYNGLERM